MVSKKLKAKYSLEKTKRAGKILLPIFSKDSVEEFAQEMLREDEDLRQMVLHNPDYLSVLHKKIGEAFSEYKGVLKGARVIDSWDRVSSAIGLVGDALGPFTAGGGYLLSAVEEASELIPKSIYALYYGLKTKDWKALPLWGAAEAASFVPYLGDAIDMTNIYVHRARAMTKEKAKQEFRKTIKPKSLERRVQEPLFLPAPA